ncbi:hypothetical protein [Rhodococcus sp. ACS1]|uniref:hypothetical protein n=1 Tax=Rhodococcus sp. ACS1 TaxID=2028570 RepID=UPI0015C81461|nr:hypothetical protein [Rhodococcus sp. ACS1]
MSGAALVFGIGALTAPAMILIAVTTNGFLTAGAVLITGAPHLDHSDRRRFNGPRRRAPMPTPIDDSRQTMTDIPVEYPARFNTTEWIKAHLERMGQADPATGETRHEPDPRTHQPD